jgi:hypothetical protein
MFPLDKIEQRVKNKPAENIATVASTLFNFSIVTYAVDPDKLRKHIPENFELFTIYIGGKQKGLVSAVSFMNKKFRFKNLFPFIQSHFGQTNYRIYIKDTGTGENCAWFLGTSLGSAWVHIPRWLWKMPWFYARYTPPGNSPYSLQMATSTGTSLLEITEEETLNFRWEGFSSAEEAMLVLTHPVKGYFRRQDGITSTYGVWHPRMEIKTGRAGNLYFEKFEEWGLVTRNEMLHPYSVLITPSIYFQVYLPPRRIE